MRSNTVRLPAWLAGGVVLLCLLAARTGLAAGTESTRLSLPKGPGSIEGLGRSFEPSLASGTASYGLDIAVPPGAGGFGPKLSLAYDGGGGETELGRGWRLAGTPRVRLRTEDGLPRFDGADVWELEGLGPLAPLVPVEGGFYRPLHEDGSFVRVQRGPDGRWEARDKAGVTYRFGGEGYEEREGTHVVSALLREAFDLHGHAVRYAWKADGGYARLARVVWNDYGDDLRHDVLFAYEARPDPLTRSSAGIRQDLAERLTAVTVQHGGRPVRRYALAYEGGRASRLQSVTMTGTDGVTAAPVLSFGYAELRLRADGQVVAMQSPPGRSPADANNDLVDLDGDGLPDLLVTQAGQYRSYLNHDGRRWQAPRDWAPSDSPSLVLSAPDVALADVDGDGALDLLAKSGLGAFRYFPGKDATHFAAPVPLAGALNVPLDGPDVRLADLDGDRRADVVVTTEAGLAVGYNQGGSGWAAPVVLGSIDPAQPLFFSDGHTSLCEMNGDRVADLCYLNPGRLVFWLGRGRGAFEPAREATGVPPFDPSDPWQLVDLDGDGRADLVHVGVSGVDLALAEGEGAFGPAQRLEGTPTKGPNAAVRFADMNGSGTTDVVWVDVSGAPDEAWQYLELFPEGRGGLLRRIDNGLGKAVTVDYAPASLGAAAARDEGRPWSTRMNVAMPVIARVTVDSSLGDPPLVTDYAYHEGAFAPAERTFAGFGRGVETDRGDDDATTLITESTFDTGLEHRVLRGAARSIEARDAAGKVFARTTRGYAVRTVATSAGGLPIEYAFAASERVEHVEGMEASRETLTEWEQDAFGNVTEERRWGEVVGEDKLAGRDEAITRRTFAQDEGDWLLGRVATEELTDGAGARVSLARLYYDGEPFVGLPLGQLARGDVSRREAWVGPDPEAFELALATAYNADGQPIETRDARGGGRLFEWDARDHTTLLAESVKLDGYVLTERAETDRAFGNLVSVTGYGGNVTAFGYDALGRLASVVRPGDTAGRPTLRYAYEQGAPLSRVVTERRLWSGRDEVETSEDLVDGLGRKRGTLTADGSGRWSLAGVALLDARGQPRRTLRARWVTDAEREAPPLQAEGPGVDRSRDALGRTTQTRSQLGLTTRTEYAPLATRTWDAAQNDPASPYEHTPTTEEHDGLGRLASKRWRLGGGEVATSFAYDAAGRLTSKADPGGHVAGYGYDGRGRRIRVTDPDAGEHVFTYDATGDLVAHRHPDGVTTRFAHDLAGRETGRDDDGDGAPEVERTWDACPRAPGDPDARGRLCAVREPSGATENDYDARGRPVRTRHVIGGAAYETTSAYDAQDREALHGFPDGSSLRLHRNARGQLAGYGDAVRVAHDADGLETERRFNTGVVEARGYDDDRRPREALARSAAGEALHHLAWTYDGAGNLTAVLDRRPGVDRTRDRSETYAYDNLYRLRRAEGTWGRTEWEYSPSGNLLARTSSEPSQHAGRAAYGAGAGPHAMTSWKGRALAYDARGRMTSDGERTYRWNAADELAGVESASGGAVRSTYDAEGTRRERLETRADGTTTVTHFLDLWSEVKDGRLVRYVVHDGRRIARLAEDTGVPAAAPPPSDRGPSPGATGALAAPHAWLALALLWALLWRHRAPLRRASRWLAPAAAALGLAVACGSDRGGEPPPIPEGTIRELGEADVLLFTDALGSLAEETSGSGRAQAAFASYPFGLGRYDSSGESRKYASSVRDGSVGLDPMGARVFAPDLGVWTSPDPVAIHDPQRSIGHDAAAANPYAYANLTPTIATDEEGLWPQVVVGAVVGAVVGGAVEAASQLASAGRIESWGKVAGQAGVGAMTGAVTALAGPQAGLATLTAIGATSGAASVMTNRLVETGGASAGSAREIAEGALVGAASAGLAAGVSKVVAKVAPKVCSCGVCFAAGTPVVTAEGEVPIEAVQVGDWVLARDEETGEFGWRQVTQTFVTPGRPLLVLTLRDADGTEEALHVTPEHPLWAEGKAWTAAGDLELGSALATADGRRVEVAALALEPDAQTVYNLEVDGFHTYFVGDNQVWAHNPCPRARPFVSTQTKDTGKNAAILRKNMAAQGETFAAGDNAHHVVASTHPRARAARNILDKYQVDINSAANGVKLPGHLHHGHGLHSNKGIDAVTSRLSAATSAKDVEAILGRIQQEILSGKFPPLEWAKGHQRRGVRAARARRP
ncbi:MAG TPA: toxin TcdB middle/N-terminal domain-containing protein [Polyangiaceae bacterium]|nr:toxin TcdB middle/N-terminal domain-containing protein [Polyangiaceae bacterium]